MLAMWLVFKITTDLSAPWVDWISGVLSGPLDAGHRPACQCSAWAIHGLSLLVIDGVIAGVGGVLAFIPVLLSLYLALAVLEDSGYMARGAFVMDRLMESHWPPRAELSAADGRLRLLCSGYLCPAVSPAVAPQDTLIRFLLMATHTQEQLNQAMDAIQTVFKKYGII